MASCVEKRKRGHSVSGFTDLVAWLALQGGDVCGARVDMEAERGLVCSSTTEPESRIIKVTGRCILQPHSNLAKLIPNSIQRAIRVAVAASSRHRTAVLTGDRASVVVQLALGCEHEAAVRSRFQPYIDYLPAEQPGLWSCAGLLDGCLPAWLPAVQRSMAHRNEFQTFVEAFRAELASHSSISIPSASKLLWACSMYFSRALRVPAIARPGCSASDSVEAMVPVVDLMNHNAGSTVAWAEQVPSSAGNRSKGPFAAIARPVLHDDAAVCIRTSVRKEAGAPLEIDYGSKSACDMLSLFGFLDEATANTMPVSLYIVLPCSDKCAEQCLPPATATSPSEQANVLGTRESDGYAIGRSSAPSSGGSHVKAASGVVSADASIGSGDTVVPTPDRSTHHLPARLALQIPTRYGTRSPTEATAATSALSSKPAVACKRCSISPVLEVTWALESEADCSEDTQNVFQHVKCALNDQLYWLEHHRQIGSGPASELINTKAYTSVSRSERPQPTKSDASARSWYDTELRHLIEVCRTHDIRLCGSLGSGIQLVLSRITRCIECVLEMALPDA